MPKHDHAAIQQGFVATTDEGPQARTHTQAWLAVAGNLERLLEVVSGGQSLRRFCEREGLSYSPVQRHLTSPDVEPLYREAQEQMAEHLMGEIERISQEIEGRVLYNDDGTPALDPKTGEPIVISMDPKAGAVILDGLKWRITKLNQRRYSDRQVVEQHVVDHAKLQMQAVRQLAARPRPALIDHDTQRPVPAAPLSAPLTQSQLDRLAILRDAELVVHANISKERKDTKD